MNSRSTSTQDHATRFPGDASPERLRSLCGNNPELGAIVALAIIAGTVGPSARVRRQAPHNEITSQVLLIIQSDAKVTCLSGLIEPVREFQKGLLADAYGGMDPMAQRLQEERIQAQRQQFLANDRFPDREHLAYFDHQLRQVRRQGRKLFHVENSHPGTLPDSLKRSPDGSLLATWTDPESFRRHCTHWATCEGKTEQDLVCGGLRGQTFTQATDDSGAPVDQPYFTGIALCSRRELKEIVESDSPLFQQPMPVFVLDGDCGLGLASRPSVDSNPTTWWRRLIPRLLTARLEQEARTFYLSPRAEAVLSAAQAGEFQQLRKDDALAPTVAVGLSVKIMLALHLCDDNPAQIIPESTAKSAVGIAHSMLEEHHRIVNEIRNEGAHEKHRRNCAVMLAKIRAKGPISQRDLIRTFDAQSLAVHGPTLDALLVCGDVFKDSNGLLCARPQEQPLTH